MIDPGEACDIEDLAGLDCTDFGFEGGSLACLPDCSDFDASACGMFGGDCCNQHNGPGCDDLECTNAVCDELGSCCESWGLLCTGLANGYCGTCGGGLEECCSAHDSQGCSDVDCVVSVCLMDSECCFGPWDESCAATAMEVCDVCSSCGDGSIDPDEQCDSDQLGAHGCETQGFVAGTLACAADCTFDTSACIPSGDGDCCSANGMPGCDDDTCTTDVCYEDETCCTSGWHDGCVALADSICDTCGGAAPMFGCVEQNLGSVVGPAVASGNTSLSDDDVIESCGTGGGPDHVMLWTAPADGEYAVDTIGSGFDTVVSVRYSCGDEGLCDDDGAGGGASEVSGYVPGGFPLVISVSGANGATGDWVINITAV
ncbi:MAG TPA: hypothetical protein VG755_32010 [Nannocystaceae bacterium]|nr:hypothetical protein [Nannocystaceae bacterium]